jgi:type IV secretory pathway TraG/TraD family ATPase VirD4
LDRRRELVLIEAAPPVLATKIRYYRERVFTRLLLPAVERPLLGRSIVEPPSMPPTDPTLSDQDIDQVLATLSTSGRSSI